MAAVSVQLLPGMTATAAHDYTIKYTTRYQVVTDSISDGALIVMNAAGLPQIWETYSVSGDTDVNAYARTMTATQNEQTRTHWEVTINWEPLKPGQSADDQETDRFNRPIRYWIEHVTYSVNVDKDKDGDPIANAAKQMFDEPLVEERSRMVLVAEKPFSTLQEIIDLNLSHAMAVNSDTFKGMAVRQALCRPIMSSQLITENNVSYYLGTFHIEMHESVWDSVIVNRGLKHYRTAGDKVLVDAVDDDGNLMAEPVLLAADGTRLADDTVGNTITFTIKREATFSSLGI